MVTASYHLTSRPGRGGWLAVTPLTGRVGQRLTGKIDVLNADVLARAIAALPPGRPEIHFQLAGLEFTDVQGTRELARLAVPAAARHLILRYPAGSPPQDHQAGPGGTPRAVRHGRGPDLRHARPRRPQPAPGC
jgi:hypothetical protein